MCEWFKCNEHDYDLMMMSLTVASHRERQWKRKRERNARDDKYHKSYSSSGNRMSLAKIFWLQRGWYLDTFGCTCNSKKESLVQNEPKLHRTLAKKVLSWTWFLIFEIPIKFDRFWEAKWEPERLIVIKESSWVDPDILVHLVIFSFEFRKKWKCGISGLMRQFLLFIISGLFSPFFHVLVLTH